MQITGFENVSVYFRGMCRDSTVW